MSDLKFYNKQDKEELVSMCMARDNKINSLKQENKQLKKDIVVLKKLQMISNNILNELEEWLKQEIDDFKQDGYNNSEKRKDSLWLAGVYDQDKRILNKIQKLKEKYK